MLLLLCDWISTVGQYQICIDLEAVGLNTHSKKKQQFKYLNEVIYHPLSFLS